ncbi:unnamed protein product [Parnassius apollo]|uniref:(apollo) hypothetical protein n=1 Tax=Parnassius apollo TaxID=110799 RepID=A0A8S3XT61_PARAO|nr:unnamed protein product [Parnassius apollo]
MLHHLKLIIKKKTTTITPKGKGIGKKSKKSIGKENKRLSPHDDKEDTYDDFKFLGYRKQKKHEMSSTSSTTSVSGTISSHSDSDIINAVSDYESNDEYHSFLGDTKLSDYINLGQTKEKILIQDEETKNINKSNIISNNNDTEHEYEQTEETLLQNEETENISKIEFISNENSYMEQEYESYSVNDHVLVKYYIKKKWTYYVGVIDAVYADEQTNEPYFSIKFYTTVKTPKLTFKMMSAGPKDHWN